MGFKGAKDFIMKDGLTEYSWEDIKSRVFSKNTPVAGCREPITKESNRLLDYTSSILSHMQDYMIAKIIEKNLHFEFRDKLLPEKVERVKLENSDLDPMAYFMFKLAIDDDRRYGAERIE